MVVMLEEKGLVNKEEKEMVVVGKDSINVECPYCEDTFTYGDWLNSISEGMYGEEYTCPSCKGVCTPSEIDGQVEKITK